VIDAPFDESAALGRDRPEIGHLRVVFEAKFASFRELWRIAGLEPADHETRRRFALLHAPQDKRSLLKLEQMRGHVHSDRRRQGHGDAHVGRRESGSRP
jgi:hypothetical protein